MVVSTRATTRSSSSERSERLVETTLRNPSDKPRSKERQPVSRQIVPAYCGPTVVVSMRATTRSSSSERSERLVETTLRNPSDKPRSKERQPVSRQIVPAYCGPTVVVSTGRSLALAARPPTGFGGLDWPLAGARCSTTYGVPHVGMGPLFRFSVHDPPLAGHGCSSACGVWSRRIAREQTPRPAARWDRRRAEFTGGCVGQGLFRGTRLRTRSRSEAGSGPSRSGCRC